MEVNAKRIPPHSLEAEQSLLGSMIMDKDAVITANNLVTHEDFYHPDNALIFKCVIHLHINQKAVDLITIQEYLKSHGILEQVGGIQYISKVAMATPTSAHAKDYAKIVKQKSFLRKSIQYANEIIASAYDNKHEDTLQNLANTPSQDDHRHEHRSIHEIMKSGFEDIAKRYKADDDIRGIRTGLVDLDKLTGGMKRGELICITADPNVGKSILALNIARYIAGKGKSSAFFAYEMTTKQLAYRLMPCEVNIPISTITHPKKNLRADSIKKIKEYNTRNITGLNIFAEDLEKKTVAELESKIRLIENLEIIVVDYLQMMEYDGRTEHDWEQFTKNSRLLKRIATKYDVPIIIISSKTKDGTVRGSSDLEFDFDQKWELLREDRESKNKWEREETELLVKKNRDGRIGKVELLYDEDYLIFRSLEK